MLRHQTAQNIEKKQQRNKEKQKRRDKREEKDMGAGAAAKTIKRSKERREGNTNDRGQREKT